jgi:hypothetical protein
MLNERALQGVHVPCRANTFNGHDGPALILHSQRQARIDALAIHEHGACATRALVTALFGACQADVIPQKVEE